MSHNGTPPRGALAEWETERAASTEEPRFAGQQHLSRCRRCGTLAIDHLGRQIHICAAS